MMTNDGPVLVRERPKMVPERFDTSKVVAVMSTAIENYTPPTRKLTIREKLHHPEVADLIISAIAKGMPIKMVLRLLKQGGISISEASFRNHLPEILSYPVDRAESDEA